MKRKLQRYLTVIVAVFMLPIGLAVLSPAKADAASCNLEDGSLLGIPPWYKYLDGEESKQMVPDGSGGLKEETLCRPDISADSGEKIPRKDIMLIVAAILEILIRMAGLAAFIYLLYGGFMYLTSNGSSEQVSNAGTTLLNAAIGLAIAISATTAVNFFANRLAAP